MNDSSKMHRSKRPSGTRSVGLRLLALSLSVAALAGLVPSARAQAVRPLVTRPIDEGRTVELPGNVRPEANSSNDRGPVADSLMMEHMQMLLQRPQETEAALESAIDQLYDKNSPDFHHWMDGQTLQERFGPSPSDVEAVTGWLTAHGMTVHGVIVSGMVVDFSGNAGQVRDTFRTEIHRLDVQGTARIANISNPVIPEALAAVVKGVVSLNDFPAKRMFTPGPEFTPGGGTGYLNLTAYPLVPGDLWTIYNFKPQFAKGISGKGQTVTVVEDTNMYNTADWSNFRSAFGLSSYTSASLTQVHPAGSAGNCTNPGVIAGVAGEATLDAEWASAGAPDAAIVLASCADTTTTFGFMLAAENLVDSKTPPAIVSMSYGVCEALLGPAANAVFNTLFQKGASEGMSIFVSSGDQLSGPCNFDLSGAAVTDGVGVNGMASTPYNVAAGGTDFADGAEGRQSLYWNPSSKNTSTFESAIKYPPEIPWNNSCASPLVVAYLGASLGLTEAYGSNGVCNNLAGLGSYYHVTLTGLINNSGGSGGPSSCATGAASTSGVVGGTCKGWPKPSWQKSLFGNPVDGVRDLPDVSLFASNGNVWGHGYVYCFSDLAKGAGGATCTKNAPGKWSVAGGTSFVAPILAGVQALINQKKDAKQGNPNPVYYSLAKTEYGSAGSSSCNSSNARPTSTTPVGSSCIFMDVTGQFESGSKIVNYGSNDAPCTAPKGSTTLHDCYRPSGTNGVLSKSNSSFEPTYPTTAGWDFATGIGSINVTNLVNAW